MNSVRKTLGNPLTSYQNTDPLKPTIRILSLIFFSFSSTTTSNMGGTNWLSEMTRYSGIIERNTVTVPNEMEEERKLKENPWPRDTFKKIYLSSQFKFLWFLQAKSLGKKNPRYKVRLHIFWTTRVQLEVKNKSIIVSDIKVQNWDYLAPSVFDISNVSW